MRKKKHEGYTSISTQLPDEVHTELRELVELTERPLTDYITRAVLAAMPSFRREAMRIRSILDEPIDLALDDKRGAA
jgi:hypothetical protein